MGHDQRFKEFLQAFLQDFLKLFYPNVEKRLDFGKIEFLDKEVFTNVADGSRREADVVAKLRSRKGLPEVVLVHVEVQARGARDVPARMFEYCALLWSRYRLPIFPIVVYLRGGSKGPANEEFRMELFGHEILRFRCQSVRLAGLDVEEYRKGSGPVGAALGALMNREHSRDLAKLRASLLLRVAESGLDEAREFLLVNLIETYFQLGADDLESYQELISRKEYRKVQDVELSWADKLLREGEEKGLEKGLEAGRLKGKRESVLRVLEAKFGVASTNTTAQVEAMGSEEELDVCLERVLKATSLEEAGLDSGL